MGEERKRVEGRNVRLVLTVGSLVVAVRRGKTELEFCNYNKIT